MGIQLYQDISVDFSNSRYILINAKQHDSKSRFIRMTCTNLGQKINLNPNDYSAFIRYRKPDGYGAFNKCIISTTGEIIFELTEQMLSTVGTSYADLIIMDIAKSDINNDLTIISADGRIIENNSSIASTMTFYVNILEKPLDNWEITSTNEFSALNDLLLKATKDYEYIVPTTKEYMDNANQSANNAKISENNTAISERKAYEEAIAAFNSALLSKSYAIGESGFLTNESWEKILTDSDDYIPVETRKNETIDNAKYYYEQCKILYEVLKNLQDVIIDLEKNVGYGNITDGATITDNAGNNIVTNEDEMLASTNTVGQGLNIIIYAIKQLQEQISELNEKMDEGSGVVTDITPPLNLNKIWLDISGGAESGIMKYYNAEKEEWTAVKAVWG